MGALHHHRGDRLRRLAHGQGLEHAPLQRFAWRTTKADTATTSRKKQPLRKRVGAGLEANVQTVKGSVDNATGALAENTAGLRASAESLRNPLGLALGGLAAGFLIGLVIPSTEYEDERLPDLREAIVGRGQEIVDDTIAAATTSAQQHGRQFISDLQNETGAGSDEHAAAGTENQGPSA